MATINIIGSIRYVITWFCTGKKASTNIIANTKYVFEKTVSGWNHQYVCDLCYEPTSEKT